MMLNRMRRHRKPAAVTPAAFPSPLHTTSSYAFVDANGVPLVLNSTNVNLFTTGWTQDKFQSIKDKGFSAVRITMYWDQFEPTSGSYDSAQLTALNNYLTYCENVGLYALIDPIHVVGSSTAPTGYSGGALSGTGWDHIPAWAPIAGEDTVATITRVGGPYIRHIMDLHGSRDVFASWEVNEPQTTATAISDQNRVLDMYEALRADVRNNSTAVKRASKIMLISGVYGDSKMVSSGVDADLTRLTEHSNVAYQMHYYYGGDVSGDGAGYSTSALTKVGTAADDSSGTASAVVASSLLETHLLVNYNWCQRKGIPMHIGEFACKSHFTNQAAWVAEMIRLFDKYRLSRSWWEWNNTTTGGSELSLTSQTSPSVVWNAIAAAVAAG